MDLLSAYVDRSRVELPCCGLVSLSSQGKGGQIPWTLAESNNAIRIPRGSGAVA